MSQLAFGEQYVSHQGKRQRIKNLRLACHDVLSSKDSMLIAAVQRLKDLTKDEPEPEYAKLHLIFKAKEAANDTGVSLIESMDYLVEKFKKLEEE